MLLCHKSKFNSILHNYFILIISYHLHNKLCILLFCSQQINRVNQKISISKIWNVKPWDIFSSIHTIPLAIQHVAFISSWACGIELSEEQTSLLCTALLWLSLLTTQPFVFLPWSQQHSALLHLNLMCNSLWFWEEENWWLIVTVTDKLWR